MDRLQKELISLEVIKTLKSRFDNFPEDEINNRNAPFHKAFLKAFSLKIENYVKSVPIFVSLSSWMHGLSTSLGQSFFENVAHILSDGESKKFEKKQYSTEQQKIISDIIIKLSNNNSIPNLKKENKSILNANKSNPIDTISFTVDNYYEESSSIVAMELKTVKPNKGTFREEKTKILIAKAALSTIYPRKKIDYFLCFPFDPLNDTPTGFNKKRFMDNSINFTKYFDPQEVLLASEFWDYLSGKKGTMEKILNIINSIASPVFLENLAFINNTGNIIKKRMKYSTILDRWNLEKEKTIFKNYDKLVQIVKGKNRLQRTLNQSLFDNDGQYNIRRANTLLDLL